MKNKTILLSIVLVVMILFGCEAKAPVLPKDFDYTITQDALDQGLSRRTVRIEINREVEQDVIKDLSEWIKHNRKDVNSCIIFYSIKDSNTLGAWARVDMPEFKFELLNNPKRD
jgi:hypothetical protein